MRSRNARVACGIVLALAAAHALAAPRTIQAPPTHKGDCRWVHGRFAVYNGRLVQRIWIIGTKRQVAIPDDETHLPDIVAAYEKAGPFLRLEDSLFADFRVCALEHSRSGQMQLVRMTGVRNPTFRGRPFYLPPIRQ